MVTYDENGIRKQHKEIVIEGGARSISDVFALLHDRDDVKDLLTYYIDFCADNYRHYRDTETISIRHFVPPMVYNEEKDAIICDVNHFSYALVYWATCSLRAAYFDMKDAFCKTTVASTNNKMLLFLYLSHAFDVFRLQQGKGYFTFVLFENQYGEHVKMAGIVMPRKAISDFGLDKKYNESLAYLAQEGVRIEEVRQVAFGGKQIAAYTQEKGIVPYLR